MSIKVGKSSLEKHLPLAMQIDKSIKILRKFIQNEAYLICIMSLARLIQDMIEQRPRHQSKQYSKV